MTRLLALIAVGRDLDLLPFSLGHYAGLGVDRLLLSVHAGLSPDAPVPPAATDWARTYGAEIVAVHRGPYVGTRRNREAALARVAGPDDWVVLADLDEFHAYPTPVPDLVAACEAGGYDHVVGGLVDRVACDGGFPAIDGRPLADQFPATVRLTGNVCGGDVAKVVLARARLGVAEGQHRALGGVPCPPAEHYVPVHHFKWDAKVFERERYMGATAIHPDDPWADGWRRWERERFLRYVAAAGGRLPLGDPLLEARLVEAHRCAACAHLPRGAAVPVRPDDPAQRHPRRTPGVTLEPDDTGVRIARPGDGPVRLDLGPDLAAWLWRSATGDLTVRQLRVWGHERLGGRSAEEVSRLIEEALAALEQAGALSCR